MLLRCSRFHREHGADGQVRSHLEESAGPVTLKSCSLTVNQLAEMNVDVAGREPGEGSPRAWMGGNCATQSKTCNCFLVPVTCTAVGAGALCVGTFGPNDCYTCAISQ